MSNRYNNSNHGRRKKHARGPLTKFRPRTAPLELSNPFKHDVRKRAFEEAIVVLGRQFPEASVAWVRKSAWASARRVPVPSRRRASGN